MYFIIFIFVLCAALRVIFVLFFIINRHVWSKRQNVVPYMGLFVFYFHFNKICV